MERGFRRQPQAHRTHRRHTEAVTCDPAGMALPASSVTTPAGGLRTRVNRVNRVNPGARTGRAVRDVSG